MAEDETRAPFATRMPFFDGAAFLRLGLWTVAAGVAVTLAVLIGSSDLGLRRIAQTFASIQGMPASPQARDEGPRDVAPRDNGEMQRLSESLSQITTDRNRMIARLEAIEHHLDDLTGSINRSAPPARASENILPPPPPTETATAPVLAASNVPAASNPPSKVVSVPAPAVQQAPVVAPAQEAPPAETPPTAKVDFGVDLGSAQTVDGLRVLWTAAKGRHGALLEGMRPIIAIRESARPGNMELRLVVGPIPTAALAARLCIVMTAAGAVCQPAVFDGQRLALR